VIMYIAKKNVFFTIFLFLLIYYPPIIGINLLHIIACFSYLYLIKNHCYLRKACKERIVLLIVGFGFILIWLLAVCLIEKKPFAVGIGYLQIVLEVLPATIAVGIYCVKKNITKEEFLDLILVVGTIQGIISVIAFVFPDVQRAILNQALKYGFDNQKYSSFLGRRYFGLAYNLVTYVPVCQSFLTIIVIHLALDKKIKYLYMVPFLIFSAIINGRSALIILCVGMGMLFIEQMRKLDVAKTLKISFITIIFLVLLIVLYNNLENWSPRTYMWLEQGIEEIKMFIFEGETGTYLSSITNVSDLMPKGTEFFAGIGEMSIGGNSRGIASDIGYINYLWMGGAVFLILVHCQFFYIIASLLKYSKKSAILRFAGIYIFIIMIIFNVKMPIFSLNEMTIMTIMIYSFLVIKKHNENKA